MIALIYGMVAVRYDLFPYTAVRTTYSGLVNMSKKAEVAALPAPEERFQTDVAALVSVKTPSQVLELRQQLIEVLFGAMHPVQKLGYLGYRALKISCS